MLVANELKDAKESEEEKIERKVSTIVQCLCPAIS